MSLSLDEVVLRSGGEGLTPGFWKNTMYMSSPNAMRMSWTREEVDARLLQIMQGIHAACLKYGKRADGSVSYIDGANVAGFVKVADAMIAQGVI